MKAWLFFALLTLAATVQAQEHSDKEIAEDIERHRAMAAAHESVAKCLEEEGAKGHDACYKKLQEHAACKSLAIGKHCGLRSHSH